MNRSHLRLGMTSTALVSTAIWLSPVNAQQPPAQPPAQTPTPQQPGPSPIAMPDVVVTATGYPEPVTNIYSTVQVINQDRIKHSSAKSVTELLAENAVGFMSEWSPGQTSINIRGGASEGQGRDFKSQVLVLINGHRAGTANVSKLSLADVQRIEIVRGPSSIVYGSQNMGGVINIILKNGRTAPGNLVEASMGSWDYFQGKAQSGGTSNSVDWYVGLSGSTQQNYQIGGVGGTEMNTAWTRQGALVAMGWQIADNHRVDVTARTDGIYDAGFRGSGANIFAFDTRYNQSVDVTYNGQTPDGRGNVYFQAYYVQDVDDLNNPSPLSTLNVTAQKTTMDHNRRQLDIVGARFQPRYKLWSTNELLVGIDWEESWIRSTRFRAGGTAVTQLSPQDNNETSNVFAIYAEDSQKLFDDRMVVRGGVRQTFGSTALDFTSNATTLIPNTVKYQATTYSVGSTLRVTDWLNGRVGASSGFRAPTATELGSNFTTTPIGTTIFGNPNLLPETSRQLEVGATLTAPAARLDLALFQNVISNRISAVTQSSIGGVVIQRYQNNPADIQVQGLEFQLEADVLRTLQIPANASWRWSLFSNGYYNFKMTDYGAVQAAGSDQATRINEYEVSIGTRFGQADTEMPWNLQLIGLLRGPMYYNTEEALSPVFFPGQVRTTTVYKKENFWVWNMRGEVDVRKGVKLFGAINNMFNVNNHPIFIALDQNPCRANFLQQNGSCGNSMPGRQFIIGAQVTF